MNLTYAPKTILRRHGMKNWFSVLGFYRLAISFPQGSKSILDQNSSALQPFPLRIHGAGIFTDIDPIKINKIHVYVNIPGNPWGFRNGILQQLHSFCNATLQKKPKAPNAFDLDEQLEAVSLGNPVRLVCQCLRKRWVDTWGVSKCCDCEQLVEVQWFSPSRSFKKV